MSFSVLTYNVNFGPFMDVYDHTTMQNIIGSSPNVILVLEAIKKADADIVCLQETNEVSTNCIVLMNRAGN